MELQLQWQTDRKSYDLSTGATFKDLELPLTQISRACHYSRLNISAMM